MITLKLRGATESHAFLVARAGVAAFALATVAWLEDPSLPLGERLDLAFGELVSMLGTEGATIAARRVELQTRSPAAAGGDESRRP